MPGDPDADDLGGALKAILRHNYDAIEEGHMVRWLRRSGYDAAWVLGDGPENLMVLDPRCVKDVRMQQPSHGDAPRSPTPALMYHLTDRAKFKLDPKFAPSDNAVAIEDRSGRPGIYLGQSVEKWVNGFGYWRPFVVEIKVDPSVVSDPGVHGRYGGELFVPSASFNKLAVLRVIPIDAHAREQFGEPGWIESAIGATFDTQQPIPRNARYPGYRYPGPDVREMPATDVARLKKQLRRVKAPQSREGSS